MEFTPKNIQISKRKKIFSRRFYLECFFQILRGLKVLHDLRIIHRDLKSANIFLNNEGVVKLGDFNVSKFSQHGLLYTQTGTPYYSRYK